MAIWWNTVPHKKTHCSNDFNPRIKHESTQKSQNQKYNPDIAVHACVTLIAESSNWAWVKTWINGFIYH